MPLLAKLIVVFNKSGMTNSNLSSDLLRVNR